MRGKGFAFLSLFETVSLEDFSLHGWQLRKDSLGRKGRGETGGGVG